MTDFYFPCHLAPSEGSHFLMFFEKKEKKRFFASLRMTDKVIILSKAFLEQPSYLY